MSSKFVNFIKINYFILLLFSYFIIFELIFLNSIFLSIYTGYSEINEKNDKS